MDTQNGADPGGGKYFFASSFPPGYYYGIQSTVDACQINIFVHQHLAIVWERCGGYAHVMRLSHWHAL